MDMKKTYYYLDQDFANNNESRPLLEDQDDDKNNSRAQHSAPEEFNVVRRVYQQDALNKDADYRVPDEPLGHQCKKAVKRCGFGDCFRHSLPIIRWLPKYKVKEYLIGDLVAGTTTAIMHIPQGMAYAMLANVPPIVGLYMAFFPVLVYVIFSTSPHLSMGTFALACLMSGKVVTEYATFHNGHSDNVTETPKIPEAAGGVEYSPTQVFSVVCMTCGIYELLMWVFRLGVLSTLLTEPLVSGFTTAAAFHVLSSQLKDIFGIKLKPPNHCIVIFTIIELVKNISKLNWAALVISIITCTIIAVNNECLKEWVSKRSRVPIPIELLAIVIGTLVSKFGHLEATYGINLVGHIPTGLPAPKLPPLELIPTVAIEAFTITMVTYTISMSLALIFAAKGKYKVHPNQELLAIGSSNLFGCFFGCGPSCASLARSYIQYQVGAKTGITLVTSATLVLFVLLWIGPFFEKLPRCVLASIICVSLKGMIIQVTELPKFWKLCKLDGIVWLMTFIVTFLGDIDIGLAAGLLASVGALFCRSQKPYTCLLGRVMNTDLYLDIKRYRAAEELPGIKIFHFCGGLNFASKNLFKAAMFHKIGYSKTSHAVKPNHLPMTDTSESDPSDPSDPASHNIHCVIIDATALSYVDAPGVKALIAVQRELVAGHITVLLAGANGPVLEMIDRFNSLETEQLQLDTFPTVHDAVVYYNVMEAKKHETLIQTNDVGERGPHCYIF